MVQVAHCSEEGACDKADSPDMITSCPGPLSTNGTWYGRTPLDFGGKIGYTDFLYTMADNPVVVRDNEVLQTRNFVDKSTLVAKVLMIFHVPESGLTSAVEFEFDQGQGEFSLQNDIVFSHLSFLPPNNKAAFLAGTYTLCACLSVLFLWAARNIIILVYQAKQSGDRVDPSTFFHEIFEIGCCVLVMVFLYRIVPYTLNSQANAQEVLDSLSSLSVTFVDPSIPFDEKVDSFLNNVERFSEVLELQANLDLFTFFYMIGISTRIVFATSVHPRTGMLTGTVMFAIGDFWHFTM